MLYYLFNFLDQLDFPGAGMFKYVSFRSGLALLLSLFISTAIGRRIINRLQMLQIGETVRNLGLEGQMSKKGTPTMGGIIIIIAILVPTILCAKLNNIYLLLMIVTTLWLGGIGFLDDYIKVFRKNKEGLHGRFKIVGQVGLGLIVGVTLYLSPDVVIKENMEVRRNNVIEEVNYHQVETKSTKTTIPFLKNNNFDYAKLVDWAGEYKVEAAWLVFVLMTIFVVTAVSNGANLTDGLDGLAPEVRLSSGWHWACWPICLLTLNLPHSSTSCLFREQKNWWCLPPHSSEPPLASFGIIPIPHRYLWEIPAVLPSVVLLQYSPLLYVKSCLSRYFVVSFSQKAYR